MVEFLDDLWNQDTSSSAASSEHQAHSVVHQVISAVRKNGTVAERAYLDSCARNMGDSKQPGLRFIPKSGLLEMNEILPTDAAMGHQMRTAGLNPQC